MAARWHFFWWSSRRVPKGQVVGLRLCPRFRGLPITGGDAEGSGGSLQFSVTEKGDEECDSATLVGIF